MEKTKVDHPIISSDDHLDLNQLPADLWSSRLPEHLRSRAPRIEIRGDKAVWICEGQDWGSWDGHAKPRTGPKFGLNAFDRGGHVDPTELRAGTPELRLADMDRDGVFAHVIYGPVTSIKHTDPELRDACYSVYNDWLADFCSVAPSRLIGVPMLPENPESATAEVLRLAEKGCFGRANLQIATAEPKLHDPRWEPFWQAIEDTGTLLSFHVVVFQPPANDPSRGKPAGFYTHSKLFVSQFIDPFVDLFAWGVIEKHPKMKLVIAEAGVGWLPWLVEEMDHRYARLWEAKEYWEGIGGGIPFHKKPSELFKNQIFVTFQESPTAIALLDFYGPDNLLWASDYPHPDSVWPDSHGVIERQMKDLSPETIRKLTFENARKLYGLEIPDDAWPKSQREAVPA